MKIINLIFSAFLVALATGCATHNYQTSVGRSATLLTDKAYLYGRFKVEREFMLATQLSLQLTNTHTGQNLGMKFRSSDDVYAVAVEPGEYQMAHLVLAKAGPNLEFVGDYHRIPLAFTAEHKELGPPFKVEAGKAYYLGDFFGKASRGWGVGMVYFYGDVTGIKLTFDETTVELKKLYPQFNGIEAKPAWRHD